MDALHKIRKEFETFAMAGLKANWHGAGTDMLTGEVDFSFDLDGKTYSVSIKELASICNLHKIEHNRGHGTTNERKRKEVRRVAS